MSARITAKQYEYLASLWERLDDPRDVSWRMSAAEASREIDAARSRLGLGKASSPAAEYRRGFEDGRQQGYNDGFDDGAEFAGSATAGPLDPDLLKRVIVMVHPDRHPPERFAAANELTAALLELRNGART